MQIIRKKYFSFVTYKMIYYIKSSTLILNWYSELTYYEENFRYARKLLKVMTSESLQRY